MNSDDISILVYDKNPRFYARLRRYFKKKDLKFKRVAGLKALDLALQEREFDLFIVTLRKADETMDESLPAIKQEFPNLFICLVAPLRDGIAENADYFCTEPHLKSYVALQEFLANILRLAGRQKKHLELSAMLLHDLRSPIQSVLGYLELLEQGVFGNINEGQKKILLNALSVGDTIIELMEDLSEVFQLERHSLRLIKSSVSPKEVMDETLRSLWIHADQKNIKLISQLSANLPTIKGDFLGIQRVLHNLIMNAIKFTPQNGTIRISANQVDNPPGKEMILFSIRDSGPGIPSEEIDAVFNKYYRLKQSKEKTKGQGLGLYIAQLIVKAHEGKIGVYNNREGGATFYFSIPAYTRNA